MNILEQQIFILYSNLAESFPNSEIIAKQISPDIENSKIFMEQIFCLYSTVCCFPCINPSLGLCKPTMQHRHVALAKIVFYYKKGLDKLCEEGIG